MSLTLGQVPTIVVSSPKAVKLFLKTHDIVFARRPVIQASKILSYGIKAIIFQQYGSYWRNVRKICALQLLSGSKIETFAPMRKEEMELLVEEIKGCAVTGEVVDLSKKVDGVVGNMTCRMVFGRSNDDEFDLKGLMGEVAFLSGAFNLSDFVPCLASFDFQGYAKRVKVLRDSLDVMFEKIISEHEEEDCQQPPKQHMDFIHTLLSMLNQPMNPNEEVVHIIDKENIKAIMLDMVAASFDTSTSVIDWTLSELFWHPHVMNRLHEELDHVIGNDRAVEEKDLVKLPYLDMVIKESLRLHPVVPLLVPHESTEDIVVDGYYIPKKSRIIVNVFAIGHDPNVWSDNVDEFLPERFVGKNLDARGRDFQLIPFGYGSRSCPGIQLGMVVVKLIIAQLIHSFDWKLLDGMLADEIDMSERFGLTLSREKHLFGISSYRLSI